VQCGDQGANEKHRCFGTIKNKLKTCCERHGEILANVSLSLFKNKDAGVNQRHDGLNVFII
jgi:hypothetical protein